MRACDRAGLVNFIHACGRFDSTCASFPSSAEDRGRERGGCRRRRAASPELRCVPEYLRHGPQPIIHAHRTDGTSADTSFSSQLRFRDREHVVDQSEEMCSPPRADHGEIFAIGVVSACGCAHQLRRIRITAFERRPQARGSMFARHTLSADWRRRRALFPPLELQRPSCTFARGSPWAAADLPLAQRMANTIRPNAESTYSTIAHHRWLPGGAGKREGEMLSSAAPDASLLIAATRKTCGPGGSEL